MRSYVLLALAAAVVTAVSLTVRQDASAIDATPAAREVPATRATQAQARHPVWIIESETNRVYLLGSIHVLRDQDYPLPALFQEAYDDAEQLVMEIDFTELDPVAMFAATRRLAMLPDGTTLRTVMGEARYADAQAAAEGIDINLAQFSRVDPWYAAMTITQLQLARLGYKAENGIEVHFANQAKEDNKPGVGLETVEEQLKILDGLPIDSQIEFLLESLADADTLIEQGNQMIDAWKSGDVAELHALFAEDLEGNPDLQQALLVERNRNWLPRIIELTRQTDDALVVVGALHLVGDDGVIELLRARGFTVRQL